MELNKKVLIGTIGYPMLSNHSVGPVLLPRLQAMEWPPQVTVDELNWGPIAVVQQFQAEEIPYDRVILLTAIERPGRAIGEISILQWQGGLPDETQIQACVGDAATGVISAENLLVIGAYFKIWPEEVYLVDVEPGAQQAGEALSPEVEAQLPQVIAAIRRLVFRGREAAKQAIPISGDKLFADG